ncbi:MAG: sulfite oxidase [Acidimicrobiia bacterium]|nr:sulfite oxidase [Acidimicrobiia bacterium]
MSTTSRRRGALSGMVAALAALAKAQLVAAFSPTLRNPILDVGDRVIDGVPSAVKEFAIDVFGTADKPALLVGIGLVTLAYSALVGVLAVRRSRLVGALGVGLFGLIGALSAVVGPAGPIGAAPSLVGAAAGIGVLLWLVREERQMDPHLAASRRSFFKAAGSAAAASVLLAGVGSLASRRFEIETDTVALPRPDRSLDPIPDGVAFPEPGLDPFVTPNADFYRIDTALTVPRIDPETWTLQISGMVDRPFTLTFDELIDRPLVESDITLTCVSNEVGGKLVGNARWLGVRLDDLLEEAGIRPEADQVVGRSVDRYTCGFPVSALDGRDALVAIGMNGEPLPLEHGFPARLIVPGLYGYVSATKWLAEIELTRFDQFDHYWVDRGWAQRAPIKTQSRIDTPAALARIPAGQTAVAGVAWAQTRGISRVEVRIDDGPWQDAELAEELNDVTWRQWRLAWDATPGRHQITVRATDGTGSVQTEERARPIPDGATGWHSIVVLVDA